MTPALALAPKSRGIRDTGIPGYGIQDTGIWDMGSRDTYGMRDNGIWDTHGTRQRAMGYSPNILPLA